MLRPRDSWPRDRPPRMVEPSQRKDREIQRCVPGDGDAPSINGARVVRRRAFHQRTQDVSRKGRDSMQRKPLIGLNADYRSGKKDSPAFTFVSAGYHDSIVAAGGIPVILPPVEDE